MELSTFIEIEKPREAVWKAIIDFQNCSDYIESILSVDIIDQPKDTLVGFKWKETRLMFGKEATETMWITDYVENEYYQTRAESHGSVYISKLSVDPAGDKTRLTMSFKGEPQSFGAKVFSFCLGFMMKGSMKKALLKDLKDIKDHLESK